MRLLSLSEASIQPRTDRFIKLGGMGVWTIRPPVPRPSLRGHHRARSPSCAQVTGDPLFCSFYDGATTTESRCLATFSRINFAKFWRARSRLYQNEILQENMRLTAFFKLYKICILLHRCNLKNFAKNWFEKSAFFVKIQQTLTFCKCCKICKILPNLRIFSWIIW